MSGQLTPADGETSEVMFTHINNKNIDQLITRPRFRSRTVDAMGSNYLPFEAFKLRPHELFSGYEVTGLWFRYFSLKP